MLFLSFFLSLSLIQAQNLCESENSQGEPNCVLESSDSLRASKSSKNVFGKPLVLCSRSPLTGFTLTGFCETGPEDHGRHTVCAEMTTEFLNFTKSQGNDLSTPNPRYGFVGLKPGDRWCLCAARWDEALKLGKAPPVITEATEEYTLKVIKMIDLKSAQSSE
ncbi:MAG: DUF2237 domain-containing protein [Bdellovibrionales bacterium]|nr:DUF2237 domain-containing protein [Bdellovibrionales bacterium]